MHIAKRLLEDTKMYSRVVLVGVVLVAVAAKICYAGISDHCIRCLGKVSNE